MVNLRVTFEGEWPSVQRAMRWFERGSHRALDKAIRTEARYLAKQMRTNLRAGGSPAFAPITPFTRVIRKAMGLNGRKPLLATHQLVRLIKHQRVGDLSFFVGVPEDSMHTTSRGTKRGVDIALLVEIGRGPIVLDLDAPSPRTGKTPRQWLWWLYLQGALSHPPSKKTTHMVLAGTPGRPFVGQTYTQEHKKAVERIVREWWMQFLAEAGKASSVAGFSAHVRMPDE